MPLPVESVHKKRLYNSIKLLEKEKNNYLSVFTLEKHGITYIIRKKRGLIFREDKK